MSQRSHLRHSEVVARVLADSDSNIRLNMPDGVLHTVYCYPCGDERALKQIGPVDYRGLFHALSSAFTDSDPGP